MIVSIGTVIAWLAVALTGQIFATVLAWRAHSNRLNTPNDMPTLNLMAWSIEIDAILTVILLGFMVFAGFAALPAAFALVDPEMSDMIRVYVIRPLVIASLSTTVIRLIVMYGFLKVIKERQEDESNE